MQIIVKSYAHVNKALGNWDTPEGKIVRSKDHYDRLMKEQGMVSYEEMQQRAQSKKLKDYKVSDDTRAIIQAAKASKDKNGKVHLGDKTIKALIDKGAIGNKVQSYMNLPSSVQEGGFSLSAEQSKIYHEES